MIHSKRLKRALAFLMAVVITFMTIFTDNVVKRVLVRAGEIESRSYVNSDATKSAPPIASTQPSASQYPKLEKIKLSYNGNELDEGASIPSNDNIKLNVKALDANDNELKITDADGNATKAYKVEWESLTYNTDNTDEYVDMQDKPTIEEDKNEGFNTELTKKDKTHKYKLKLKVTDNNGNSSAISVTAVIDTVATTMKINETSSSDSEERVFEVTVTDDQDLYSDFENDDLYKLIYVLDNSGNKITDAVSSAEKAGSDDEKNSVKYTVTLNKDMANKCSINAKDLAGNYSESIQLDAIEYDLKGLSATETTYIGKDGKEVSFPFSDEFKNVKWGYALDNLNKVEAENGNYKFKIDATNLNEGEKTIYVVLEKNNITVEKQYKIYIDKTAPKVVSDSITDNFKKNGEWIINNNAWMKFTVEDKSNDGAESSKLDYVKVYRTKEDFDISKDALDEEALIHDKDSIGDKEYEVELDSNALCDGSYKIIVAIGDVAGNKNVEEIANIKKDTAAPEGKITLSGLETVWDKFAEPGFGNIYSKDDQTFSVNCSDATSGIYEAKYYVTSTVAGAIKSVEDLEKLEETDWKKLNKIEEGKYKTNYVTAISSSVVYVKLKDAAGNIKYICSDGVVIDNKMTIEAPTEIPWTNDPKIEITMNASISGFDSYKVTRVVDKEEETILESTEKEISAINDNFEPDKEKITTLNINKDNTEFREGENTFTFKVWAKNKSGVELETEHTIQIQYDCTKPVVDSITDNFKKNGEWIINNNAWMKFTVEDKSNDGAESSKLDYVKVYRTKEDFDISKDALDEEALIHDKDSIGDKEYEVELDSNALCDGSYKIIVAIGDVAGNKNVEEIANIKKDTTAPEGKITLSGLETVWDKFAEPGFGNIYSKDDQTFSVNCSDATSGIYEAKYYVTSTVAGAIKSVEDLEKLEETDWKKLNKIEEGKYKTNYVTAISSSVVYVRLKDAAGNIKYICSDGVVIDNKMEIDAPSEISWTNNPKIEIMMNASISGFDSYKVTRVVGEKDKTILESTEEEIAAINKEFGLDEEKTKTLTINKDTDGIIQGEYTLKVWAKNKAGVELERKIQIQYDSTPVEIKIDEEKKFDKSVKETNGWVNSANEAELSIDLLDEGEQPSGIKTMLIYELRNVNATQLYNYVKNINNNELTGFLADEFIIENMSFDDEKSYTYQYKPEEDGEYYILVVATDKTGNKSADYKLIKRDTTIDKPVYTIQGFDNWINCSNNADAKIDVSLEDKTSGIDDDTVIVTLENVSNNNRKTIYVNNNEKYIKNVEKSGNNNNISFEVLFSKLKDGEYKISISYKDNAQNLITEKVTTIKKDTNVPEITGSERLLGWINKYNINKEAKSLVVEISDNGSGINDDKISVYRGENKANVLSCGSTYDENVCTIDIPMEKMPDGQYKIYVEAEDNAGNSHRISIPIKKDTKEASIAISEPDKMHDGWVNKDDNNNSKVKVTIKDKISGIDDYKVYVCDENGKNEEEIEYTLEDDFDNKKVLYINIKNVSDGKHKIKVISTDKAGNIQKETKDIKKDTKSPDCDIKLKSDDGDLKSNKFSNKAEDFKLTNFRDATSEIKSVSYYITNEISSVISSKDIDKIKNWNEVTVNNDGDIFIPIYNGKDVDAVIYVKLEDNAGNVKYLRSNGIITIDQHSPEAVVSGNDEPIISIDVASGDIGKDGIYKSVPVVKYAIQDKKYDFAYSGLKKITYTVTNEITGVSNGDEICVDGGDERTPEHSGTIKLSSLGEDVYNGNNIKVEITAEDNAGNVYTPSGKLISIDTTKPAVEVSYKDSTGAEVEPNGRFFNNDVTMVVTVTERNFDSDATLFRINGQQISLNAMTHISDFAAGGNGDGDTHTYEYRFTGDEANDKDYTVEYVSCTDKAGNVSDSTITSQTFTVDKVQPAVSANDAAGYSSSALTYTASVVERNFDEAGAKVLVTRRLNGSLSYENREYPVIWSTSGDTHTAALSFAEDGDYSFTITCTDKAGNPQAAVYTSKEFTVDNVDPVITSNISEENNNIANKGNIDFEYVYTDINSSNEPGMIDYKVRTLAGTAVNDWVPEIKNINVDGVNGYTINFRDNATATKLKDGIYTIELTVKDRAGREAKDEKQFSVNRHGSAYSYISSSYTGAVILQQYVKEITDDIEVVVMNCDDITQYQVEVWNSLNEQNILKPDEEYTWKKESSGYVYKEGNSNRESGFTMYSCRIKPEVFSNEGTYTVRVSTKDIADDAAYGDNAALLYNDDTNTDNNMDVTTNMDTTQADKIEFTVDRTNPEIVIMDIDNNGKYNLDKKFSFDYADANELDGIQLVRKDGDKVLETITYKPSELKDLRTGNVSAVAKEYDGYQTITISATDKAGNTGSASVKVLVTSNIWVKYINNTPLVVATIVVAAAAAGGIVFIFYRRRRREEQN